MVTLRNDFPFIQKHPDIHYMDNAATTLKPQTVIDAVTYYYTDLSANVHRGDYETSLLVSAAYDAVREKVAAFIHATSETIIFTSGASAALNQIAYSYCRQLQAGDVILVNEAEHASNLLPWFAVAESTGAVIEYMALDASGKVSLENLKKALHDRVKVVAIAHITNVLGSVHDIKAMAPMVHEYDADIIVDGAQSVGHIPVDVVELGVDSYVFSAHKMLGPTGVGVLYVHPDKLKTLEPYLRGGGTYLRFTKDLEIVYKDNSEKFEAGTPNIEGVLGLGAAVDYLQTLGMDTVQPMIKNLSQRLLTKLQALDTIILMNKEAESGIISFNVKGIFAQDVAIYLGHHGFPVRSGEHCARLFNEALDFQKSVRVSLYIYNTLEEVDAFVSVLETITLEKVLEYVV